MGIRNARATVVAERVLWASLDLLFPPRCEHCQQLGERLCANCRADIEYLPPTICQQCGYPKEAPVTDDCDQCRRVPFSGRAIRSIAFHAGPVRSAIHSLKYRHNPPLAEALAILMHQHLPADVPTDGVLLPVPLGEARRRARGFNQAEALARHFAVGGRWAVLPNALKRRRETPSQVGLSAAQRRANVSGAFVADKQSVNGQVIILIDDVCTTGATLSACAAALQEEGAQEVWALTLARAKLTGAD